MATCESDFDSDCGRWSRLLVPHLEHALTASQSYTGDEARSHVAFFSAHVTRWLGPAPAVASPSSGSSTSSRGMVAAYPSALTADHTPLEISYSWKGTAPASVRYVVDIVPPGAQATRAASLAPAGRAIDGLRALALPRGGAGTAAPGPEVPAVPAVSAPPAPSAPPPLAAQNQQQQQEQEQQKQYAIDLLPDLWTSVTAQLAHFEHDIHPTNRPACNSCGSSSTFVGFDLVRARARAKLYWLLPACLPAAALLALLDAIFARCLAHGHLTPLTGFAAHWAQVRNYLLTHGTDTLRPRMLSCDATRYPFPRVKIYTRCYFASDESFDVIEAHLTLRGAICLQPRSRDQYAALWACLMDNYRLHTHDAQRQKHQRYCMIAYDIFPAPDGDDGPNSGLASKLYLFCDQMPGHDAFVARELLGPFSAPAGFFRRYVHLPCPSLDMPVF